MPDEGGAAPLLEVREISKDFPGQRALDNVSMTLRRGEIHALLGENGAGKSTLIKIITGVYHANGGQVLVDGRVIHFNHAHAAQAAGIAVVHQHGNLVPSLTVQENLMLGERLPCRAGVFIHWGAVRERAARLLRRVGLSISPTTLVSALRPDEVAMVSIAKAIATDAKIIILDEPTTALLPGEVATLFAQMRRLASEGHGFLYVSHRLSEVFDIADRATVLRDGKRVWSCDDRSGLRRDDVVSAIVGKERELATVVDTAPLSHALGAELLAVTELSSARVNKVSFTLKAGEIVGLAGLPGSGAEETLDLIYGRDAQSGGTIAVSGVIARFSSPRAAVAAGLALVPKERLAEAAMPGFSVRENVSLPSLARFVTDPILRLIKRGKERTLVQDVVARLNVKTVSLEAKIDSLSGGNQQKAILARWLGTNAKVYLLNSPTAAVDVGAKAEIYRLLKDLAANGAAVLFTSTEVEEFPRLCSRVLVFRGGSVVAELHGIATTEAQILRLAAGVEEQQKVA